MLFNEIVGANQNMAQQLERIGKSVGEQGRTRQRVKFGISTAAWGEMEGSVNGLIDDLVWPTTEVTRVIAAVAQGDLLQTVRLEVDGRPLKGEFLRSATIVNTMIKQLSRVHLRSDARGARGRHRRQAGRPGQGERSDRRVARADRVASTRWPTT